MLGERVAPLGPLDESGLVERIHAARAALAGAVAADLFVPEQTLSFEFRYHFDGVDTWLDYMRQDWVSATVDPAQVERARALLPPGAGTLRIREQVHAARHGRRSPVPGRRR